MMIRKLFTAALLACCALTLSAAAGQVTLGLGHGQTVVSVAHLSLVDMAEKIKERSGGTLEIQIFPANQLGNERDLAEGLTMETIDMAWVSTAVMENFDSKLSMFALPYVFKSYDHVADVIASDIGDYVFGSLLESQDVRMLGFFDQGFRWVWNNKRPINNLEDMAGLKVRAPESPVYMGTFKLLGTNPTPIPWGEVYTSMQTGVVDGFEVHPESFSSNGMAEVTKYGTRTNHIYAGSVLMIREDIWQGLSAEHQTIVREEAANAVAANRKAIIENEQAYLKEAEEKGVELVILDDAELDKMADAVRPLYKDYASRLGSEDLIPRAQAMYTK